MTENIILLSKWLTPDFAKKYLKRHEKRSVLANHCINGYSQVDRYRAIAAGRDWDNSRNAKLEWRGA